MLPLQRVEERIRIINTALLPLLRGIRRYIAIWSQLRRISNKPLETYSSRDYTVTVLFAEIPGSNPLLIAFYTSTQSSRPISPSQLAARMKRLLKEVKKLRNKIFTSADILYVIYSPRGFTKGAKKTAHRIGVNLASSTKELLAPIARYITKRYNKLLQAISGKKIWGDLPLLIYALQEIGLSIGASIKKSLDPPMLIELAEKGGVLSNTML